ncbi:MAG: cation:proton antiporter [Victivallales bacterium]|nr:cation:proton antiporter [Victivallales bacterium]
MNSSIFLILFIIFIAFITLVPIALRRLGIPGVIALLIVGMAVGPSGLNLVHHLSALLAGGLGGSAELAEQHFNTLIDELGSLGLVFLMALAGMEADFKLIRSARKPVAMMSLLTFALPAITGYLVYQFFRHDDLAGKLLYASLFASHSVGIVFPVMRELGLSKTRFGAAVLISTVITDIASIILLAVAVQLRRTQLGVSYSNGGLSIFNAIDPKLFGAWFTPLFLAVILLFIVISTFAVNKIGRRMIKRLEGNADLLVTFLLLAILATVLAGECFGINLIVGAFIAGLALSPMLHKEGINAAVFYKFEGIGYGLLIPFLFISIGMDTDFSAFISVSNMTIILLTVSGLIASKLFSGWLALRLTGFKNAEGLCAGFMTVPQLSATLAAAAIGKSLDMLDGNFFNAIIILSIVTTLPVPSIVRAIIRHYGLKFEPETKVEAFQVPEAIVEEDEIL